jgi:hypothetical protein
MPTSGARHEAINELFAREQGAERARFEAEEKKGLAPITKKLIADPRFNAPKISAAKRLALAETNFPSQDRTTLEKAIERAVRAVAQSIPGVGGPPRISLLRR